MKKRTKFLSFILAILLIVTVVPMTVLAKADVPGDINGDSNVTSADARLALRFAVGLEAFTAKQTKIADVDGKPGITSADARLILRAAVGLEDLSITENTTAAPVVENTTAAPVETPTQAPAPTYQPPSTKQEIVNFYAKAANDLKNNGAAGYTKKEWQSFDNVNLGSGIVNSAVSSVLGSFMTKEADAEEQVNAMGSDDAKRRAFGWTLKDLSKVASAKCDVLPNGNYKITIVMVDEDTPKKKGSMLGQVTGALLYWEDIEETLTTDPTVTKILSEFDNIHVIYKGYTITAEMTPDGRFVTLDHLADIDIEIGHIKLLAFSLDNKYAHMNNYCKFYNFQYPGYTSPTPETTTRAPIENTTHAPVENTTAAPAYQPPSSKQDIVNFYAKAANDLKNNGAAGYTKKEWQNVDEINIGNSIVNSAVKSVLGSFMTVEADAQEQLNAKGSDDAKRRAFGWTLKDLSKVASAKCEVLKNGNYKITIVMVDEDTPKKKGSILGQVTGAVLFWEDIETTLTTDPTVTKILSEFDDIHVIYKGFTIIAEMTPDGKFVTLDHLADVDIKIGHIKLLGISIDNKYGHMNNYCKFYNFQYPGYTSPTPETTTRAPIENTTWAPPVENTTCAPVIENTTCAPATTTHVAIENTTAAPVEYTTWAPVEYTTCAPAHP